MQVRVCVLPGMRLALSSAAAGWNTCSGPGRLALCLRLAGGPVTEGITELSMPATLAVLDRSIVGIGSRVHGNACGRKRADGRDCKSDRAHFDPPRQSPPNRVCLTES